MFRLQLLALRRVRVHGEMWIDHRTAPAVSQHLSAITQTSFRLAAAFVYIVTNGAGALLTKIKIPREEVTFVPCFPGRFMTVYLQSIEDIMILS